MTRGRLRLRAKCSRSGVSVKACSIVVVSADSEKEELLVEAVHESVSSTSSRRPDDRPRSLNSHQRADYEHRHGVSYHHLALFLDDPSVASGWRFEARAQRMFLCGSTEARRHDTDAAIINMQLVGIDACRPGCRLLEDLRLLAFPGCSSAQGSSQVPW